MCIHFNIFINFKFLLISNVFLKFNVFIDFNFKHFNQFLMFLFIWIFLLILNI